MTSKDALLELISTFYDKDLEEIKIIEKDLEILEIIKKKKVDINVLSINSFNGYNFGLEKEQRLTETEFNFLKEWLER